MSWATTLSVNQDDPRGLSVLLLYVDFLIFSGGQRPITDQPETNGGHRISTQVTHFIHALKGFAKLAHAPQLLADKINKDEPNTLAAYGFPRMLVTRFSVWTPRMGKAQEWLARSMSEIGDDISGLHSSMIWRRWAPGIPESQMREQHITWAQPLWKRPKMRRNVKDSMTKSPSHFGSSSWRLRGTFGRSSMMNPSPRVGWVGWMIWVVWGGAISTPYKLSSLGKRRR